ncbi:3-hydroxyisobutyrate dehydrogenase-like beta-hydroxyacid dehydrogenase [Glycomyces algeriensis]|uniref:6-phosphogluconate dehydrogenase n=2 Tax=Glycomyces algeriensis TaxID=256037 RepID=A0A9W6G9I4_9ACTN|nr:3-hydroxyisobutyrate dehydrogenase-like beta-hydroxyacid dehydrogenase [Glycomyces algeriensis]GLI43790.1 6-phosphogluconate dehydrogenase [Glycomyces algeriensis]
MPKGTISILGLGAMGSAIAARLRDTGYTTTVWNRTTAKTAPHAAAGSTAAATITEAVQASDIIVAVLLDHASIHANLEPAAADLKGKVLVNLTTTTPNEAKTTATWAAEHGITYLDGAIMAIPEMIGGPAARLLYSGDENAYAIARPALETLGTAEYEGTDPGRASLKDMALLTAMYSMFNGYFQAAAMMRTVGVSAEATAQEVIAYNGALLPHIAHYAALIEHRDYSAGQSVDFTRTAVGSLITAAREQGVSADALEPLARRLDELTATGRSTADWISVIEQLTIK